jgi:hypothetical protein
MGHCRHSWDAVTSVLLCAFVDNMLSPHVVELMIQSTEAVPRGPQHGSSGAVLLAWPCLVVATDTADRSTASKKAMCESAVDNTVDVVGEVSRLAAHAACLRSARGPLLRSSATAPKSRAVASGFMGFDVFWSFFRRAGRGAAGGPKSTELTSMHALTAAPDRAQCTTLASVTGVDGTKASAMGGELEAMFWRRTAICRNCLGAASQ